MLHNISKILILPFIICSNAALASTSKYSMGVSSSFSAHTSKVKGSASYNNERLDNGAGVGLILGYQPNEILRLTLEPQYKYFGYTSYQSIYGVVSQDISNMSLFFNSYWTLLPSSSIKPFVVAGFGYSKNISHDLIEVSTARYPGIDVTRRLAWNLGVGFSYSASKACDILIGYKFSHLGKFGVKDDCFEEFGKNNCIAGGAGELKPHEIFISVLYKF